MAILKEMESWTIAKAKTFIIIIIIIIKRRN